MSIEVAIKKSFPNMFRPMKWLHFDLPTDYGRGEWFAHGVRGTFHVYDSREKFPNEKPYYAKNISEMFDTLEQAQAACQTRNEGDTLVGLSPDFLSTIADLQRENAALKLEAQCHAMEARTANSTINEIYQVITGARGEPGNWHGAEPVRKFVAQMHAALLPFSKAAQIKLCGQWRDDERFAQTDVGFHLTFGDLRRAHIALASTGKEHHAE